MCFFKETPQLSYLQIDDQVLETVRSLKFLGLVIQDSLEWNEWNECTVALCNNRRTL